MDNNRKFWNQEQQLLRCFISRKHDYAGAVEFALRQHAMVHTESMSHCGLWSFEDEVLAGLSDKDFRIIPPDAEHSIAWVLWHIARIEDVTMNVLIAGCPQILHTGNWLERIQSPIHHTGNAMDVAAVQIFSADIDIDALRAYRIAVGRQTREIIKHLPGSAFKQTTDPFRLQHIRDAKYVLPEAEEILTYWGNQTVAGLLLMPATRHCFLHLNEAARLRKKLIGSHKSRH